MDGGKGCHRQESVLANRWAKIQQFPSGASSGQSSQKLSKQRNVAGAKGIYRQ
jgi:hypothetical protein